MKKGESSIILLNTRLHRTVTILRFKLLDMITVCFEKGVLYFGRGEHLAYKYVTLYKPFSFNGDNQTVMLKTTIKTDILFPTFFIFPIDKSPVPVYTVHITHKQFDRLLCDVSLRI